MLTQTRFALLTFACALATNPAHASFPGQPAGECAHIGAIKWIIPNTTTVCESDTLELADRTTNPFQVGFSESRAVTGEAPGSDVRVQCVPDFIPGAELRGILTLVGSEDARDANNGDDCGDANISADTVALTVMLEIEKNGKHLVAARAIAGCGKVDLAPWNDEGDSLESTLFMANPNSSLFDSNLDFEDDVYDFAIATGILPPGSDRSTAPLVVGDEFSNVFRKNVPSNAAPSTACMNGCGPGEVDARGDNQAASVARYRITIRFANPGTPPGLSSDFCYPGN
jgi:hypothetical protein